MKNNVIELCLWLKYIYANNFFKYIIQKLLSKEDEKRVLDNRL